MYIKTTKIHCWYPHLSYNKLYATVSCQKNPDAIFQTEAIVSINFSVWFSGILKFQIFITLLRLQYNRTSMEQRARRAADNVNNSAKVWKIGVFVLESISELFIVFVRSVQTSRSSDFIILLVRW